MSTGSELKLPKLPERETKEKITLEVNAALLKRVRDAIVERSKIQKKRFTLRDAVEFGMECFLIEHNVEKGKR